MSRKIQIFQGKVLKILSGKIDDFYLGGGTALSRVYFRHRLSLDLDFFTQKFSLKRIKEVAELVANKTNKKIELFAQQIKDPKKVKICVYHLPISEAKGLKLDFIEDYVKLIKPLLEVEGIKVLSLEDIYLRKVYAITGTVQLLDVIGRKVSTGRQEAKDFYDLYFLSHTFMPLAKFVRKFCSRIEMEGLIHWYRTYDRLQMKSGLLDLVAEKKLDYSIMERHFKEEVNKLIKEELKFI